MNRTAPHPISRPSLALLGTEPWRAAYEFAQHKIARKAPTPTGDGHPVVIFPGLATDGAAVAPLRDYCAALGYSAMDWGRGFNTGPQGDIDTWLAELADHVSSTLLAGHSQRATLIGWSLGGIYARELGKLLAPRLRQVITIGTPFNGSSDQTHAGWLFRLLNGAAPVNHPALSLRLRTPPPVLTTSIIAAPTGWWPGKAAAMRRPEAGCGTSKSGAATSGWAGIRRCCASSKDCCGRGRLRAPDLRLERGTSLPVAVEKRDHPFGRTPREPRVTAAGHGLAAGRAVDPSTVLCLVPAGRGAA